MIFGSKLRELAGSPGGFAKQNMEEVRMMIQTFLKRLAMLSAMAGSLTLLAGCNTMEGLGQDTQEAGEALEQSAD
ncbi:entericidin A/B family lipoprotein [Guyparkeria sp.]|uniref:entericidin A/B family lipoprotein n=1 Tax=Guyparkeria sp. TaxID=2035736 RepID=UPI003970F94A